MNSVKVLLHLGKTPVCCSFYVLCGARGALDFMVPTASRVPGKMREGFPVLEKL